MPKLRPWGQSLVCIVVLTTLVLAISRFGHGCSVESSSIEINVDGTEIAVYYYKPEGVGPFPLLVLSHGWASLAAATRSSVTGVVSFAGGRGSAGPDKVCGEAELIHTAAIYGKASHVQELWIYSQNDHFFGPSLAHRLFDAFTTAGGQATIFSAPPYGADGHNYFDDVTAWKPRVDTFLRQIGFLSPT